jgi:hypothetical protein
MTDVTERADDWRDHSSAFSDCRRVSASAKFARPGSSPSFMFVAAQPPHAPPHGDRGHPRASLANTLRPNSGPAAGSPNRDAPTRDGVVVGLCAIGRPLSRPGIDWSPRRQAGTAAQGSRRCLGDPAATAGRTRPKSPKSVCNDIARRFADGAVVPRRDALGYRDGIPLVRDVRWRGSVQLSTARIWRAALRANRPENFLSG